MLNARTNKEELVNAGTDNNRLARGASIGHGTRTNTRNPRLALVLLFALVGGLPGLVSAALAQDGTEIGALNGKSAEKGKAVEEEKKKEGDAAAAAGNKLKSLGEEIENAGGSTKPPSSTGGGSVKPPSSTSGSGTKPPGFSTKGLPKQKTAGWLRFPDGKGSWTNTRVGSSRVGG
jgi:hypothetical protein